MRQNLHMSIGAAALAAAFAVLAPSSAEARSPQPASGEFVVGFPLSFAVQPAGEIYMIELTTEFHLEGTLTGTFIADFLILHFGAFDEPADEVFIAQGTFDGEVDGAVGNFDFMFVGEISADGFAEGELVIGRGFGELAGLSGQLTLSGTAGVDGIYEGHIHFAP